MNNVILIGRLTKDPEVKYTNSGSSVARFTLAVDRQYKKDGEPTADFVQCVSFGKTAEVIEKYCEKGKQIAVQGRIQTGSYEKDGKRVYTTDIIVDRMEFIGTKSEAGESRPTAKGTEDFVNVPDDIDEYLPFA